MSDLPLFQDNTNPNELCRIHWENMDGAGKGVGLKVLPRIEATKLAAELNDFKPSIRHWVVPVKVKA